MIHTAAAPADDTPAPRSARGPNLFVVGAAKSGTTSVWYGLGQHPDVWMAPVKEPHTHATDLGLRANPLLDQRPELFLPPQPVDFWSARQHLVSEGYDRDLDAYLRLFDQRDRDRAARVVGEASTSYLLSAEAAGNVARHHPGARALVLLRNPVDVVLSLHAMHRQATGVPARVLDAVRTPPVLTPGVAPGSAVWRDYRRVVRFADQLARWQDALGVDHVRVELLDDLVADPAGWWRRLFTWLDVDPDVALDLRPTNENRRPLNRRLTRWLVQRGRVATPGARRVLATGLRLATRRVPRPTVSAADRAALHALLDPEVRALEERLDRDLSHWTATR